MKPALPLVVLGATGLAVLWGELVHLRASCSIVHPDRGGSEAVVVLGHRNRDGQRADVVNRWRVRAGLRSLDPAAGSSRVILCGGSPDGVARSEAALMGRYAVDERAFAGDMVLEDQSHSTWQNVANAIPLVEDAERIKIVSNSLHAQKARLYLCRQRPDLAVRLVRAADYRAGEWALLKPFLAVYGLATLAKAKRHAREMPRTPQEKGISGR